MTITVTDTNFKEVVTTDKPVLIDFWAPWCGPCRMIAPIIDELATEYAGKAIIAKCDVDTSSEVSLKFGIRSIPTLLFFKSGELKEKIVGSATKGGIAAKLDALLKQP
jgi:thioredoxin 1